MNKIGIIGEPMKNKRELIEALGIRNVAQVMIEQKHDIERLEAENYALKAFLKATGKMVVEVEYKLNTSELHYLMVALQAGNYLVFSSGPKRLHPGSYSQEIGVLVAEKQDDK